MTTATLPPSGTGRTSTRRRYDWAAYVDRLLRFPDQWLMLHPDADGRAITYARAGKQRDIAPHARNIEWRTRNNVSIGNSHRGELWARYTPTKAADNGHTISDEQVAALRAEHAATRTPVAELAKKYGTSYSNVNMLVRGQRRADAPGPIYGIDYSARAGRSARSPRPAPAEVARVAQEADALGKSARTHIAATFDAPLPTADKWLRAARDIEEAGR